MNKVVKGQKEKITGDLIEKELDSIKKLLVLLLLKVGVKQDEVGAALGINQSTISRWFPGIKIQKFIDSK